VGRLRAIPTRSPTVASRAGRAALAGALLLLPLLAAPAAAEPATCSVGIYLISLHDFDMNRGSFGADAWYWSSCRDPALRPLDVMDLVDAQEVTTSLAATYERSGIFWSYVKVSGTFRHHWDVQNYPFDRHVLRIAIENTAAPASEFAYSVDREGSKPSRDIRLDGWRMTSFEVMPEVYVYDTTFGDPAFEGKEESDYARLVLSVGIQRTKLLSFVKLVAGVYASFALSSLSYLLGPYNGRRRANLLVGTLFAVLVNQRVVESVIGRTEEITLVDQIHLIAMAFIFATALAGIRSQILFDRGEQERASRHDIRGLWITCVSYVAVNAVVIGNAALKG
jgi:hypothetical protein